VAEVIALGKQLAKPLNRRRPITVDLPEFIVRAIEWRVDEANADSSNPEEVTFNDVVEWLLVSEVTTKRIPALEQSIPGFAAANVRMVDGGDVSVGGGITIGHSYKPMPWQRHAPQTTASHHLSIRVGLQLRLLQFGSDAAQPHSVLILPGHLRSQAVRIGVDMPVINAVLEQASTKIQDHLSINKESHKTLRIKDLSRFRVNGEKTALRAYPLEC
jgi:hypothetical protein